MILDPLLNRNSNKSKPVISTGAKTAKMEEKPEYFIQHIIKKQMNGKFNILSAGIGGIIDEYRVHQEEAGHVKEKYMTYEAITDNGRLSQQYFILLILSCLIATMGLIENSPAIIIGAMIVSPLMNPIFAFSAGVLWGSVTAIARSIATLALGIFTVLLITALLAWAVPGILVTPEMTARTHPAIYDIIVAICCGLVGAYGFANIRISNALSGVAISVALMPPLSTAGIGIGLNNPEMFRGSILLFFINLIGISLAAVVVFYLVRLKPHLEDSKEASKIRRRVFSQVFLSIIIIVIITVPMVYFMQTRYKQIYTDKIVHDILNSGLTGTEIYSLKIIDDKDPVRIDVVVLKSSGLPWEKPKNLESKLQSALKREVRMNVYSINRVPE